MFIPVERIISGRNKTGRMRMEFQTDLLAHGILGGVTETEVRAVLVEALNKIVRLAEEKPEPE